MHKHDWANSFASTKNRPLSFCRTCRDERGAVVFKFSYAWERGGRTKSFSNVSSIYREQKDALERIPAMMLVEGSKERLLPWWMRLMYESIQDAREVAKHFPSSAELDAWDG